MFNLMVMPASPALAVELSSNDAASRALLAAARTLAVEAAAAGITLVHRPHRQLKGVGCSHEPRRRQLSTRDYGPVRAAQCAAA